MSGSARRDYNLAGNAMAHVYCCLWTKRAEPSTTAEVDRPAWLSPKRYTVRRAFPFAIVLIVAAIAGCSAYRDGEFKRAELRQAAEQKKQIRLSDFTPFEWDRVYYFAAYYKPSDMQKAMGTSVLFPDIEFHHGASEGDWTLVFLKGKKVQASVSDMSLQIDFDMAVTEWLRPEEAVFQPGEPNKGGWIQLEKTVKDRPARTSLQATDPAHR